MENLCEPSTVMRGVEEDNVSNTRLMYTDGTSMRQALVTGTLEWLNMYNGIVGRGGIQNPPVRIGQVSRGK